MPLSLRLAAIALIVLVAPFSNAAVFVVPDDDAFIRQSGLIVTGTVVDQRVELHSDGMVMTVVRVAVDEVLRGSHEGEILELVEAGGIFGNRMTMASGAPEYETGQRYLIAVARWHGRFTTKDLALGQFRFARSNGETILLRNLEAISGWDRDGKPIEDRPRSASRFLQSIREASAMWSDDANATMPAAPMANDLDTQMAVTIGATGWSEGSIVEFTISPVAATGNTKDLNDGEERIIVDDPHDDIEGTFPSTSSVVARAFYSAEFEVGHANIIAADIVVQDGVSSTTLDQDRYNSALASQLGRTLGLRYSDRTADGGGACNTADCATTAIMSSVLGVGLNGVLQPWDQRALAANFATTGSFDSEYLSFKILPWHRDVPVVAWKLEHPVATCTGPTIQVQPQSVSTSEGISVLLTVSATASVGSLAYQWYEGASGNTGHPVGIGGSSLMVSPPATTMYWVRVTDGCASTPSVDSATATVTVKVAGALITSVTPRSGPYTGGTNVTILGADFQNGASVSFGGTPAVAVTYVSSGELIASTPPHAPGVVSVVVMNPDSSLATRKDGFTYQNELSIPGDANGGGSVDVGDIFYLINYFFADGPMPVGDGDANSSGSLEIGDIFFLINYLFAGGAAPSTTI